MAEAVVLFFPDMPEYKRLEQHPVDFTGVTPVFGFTMTAFNQPFLLQFL